MNSLLQNYVNSVNETIFHETTHSSFNDKQDIGYKTKSGSPLVWVLLPLKRETIFTLQTQQHLQ